MEERKRYNSLHVTPLVEIFNICVNGNVHDEFRVYGSIDVTDRGHTFSMYDRTIDSPQIMVSGDKLLLTVDEYFHDDVIIPSVYVSLNVNLIAISGDDEITLENSIPLVRTVEDDWSEEYKDVKVAENNNWNAKVQYAIFPYAVPAIVRVIHFSKDDDFDSRVVPPEDDYYERSGERDRANYKKHSCSDITKIDGSVFACASVCGNNVQMPLFSTGVEDCVEVQSGKCIDLSRSLVVVPAYSSLKIEVSFKDGKNGSVIADDTVEFKPVDWGTYKKDIARGNGRIRVQVFWCFAYDQLYRNYPNGMLNPTTLDSRDDDSLKKQRVMSKQPPSATLNDDCSLPEHNSSETYTSNWVLPTSTYTEKLLELFSVVVCSKDSKNFKFYGKIYFADGGKPKYIFQRDESCPLDCPTSGMPVIIKGPQRECLSLLLDFAVVVDIRDASSKAAISHGLFPVRRLDRELLGNRRICSVIRGEQGFAVVHYSIFPEGVSATVDIKVIKRSCKYLPAIIIKGEICAEYGNCEPGRCYEDKFFKNLLFFNEDDGVRLNDSECKLPLLKPLLALPIKSILIIEADLLVSTVEGPKSLKGNIKFCNNKNSPQHLGNDDICLEVSVHFRSVQ